jgi:predicted  nucleic acid-binding Zn-ribbon protein
VDRSDDDKRAAFALQRAVVTILSSIRRILGGVYQLIFRDRLRDIDEQTERLGAASVEAVTHLGSEVRALESRLNSIERELTALRELLERRERGEAEEVPLRPPAG